MSTDPEAKLFYGYMQPDADRDRYRELREDEDYDTETPWSATHTKQVHGCIGGMYGYDGNLGFFLAVEEALYVTEWDHVFHLMPYNFQVKPEWDEQLRQAAEYFGLDVTGLVTGWYLVCLYF